MSEYPISGFMVTGFIRNLLDIAALNGDRAHQAASLLIEVDVVGQVVPLLKLLRDVLSLRTPERNQLLVNNTSPRPGKGLSALGQNVVEAGLGDEGHLPLLASDYERKEQMLILLTEPNKVPDVTLAVLHQIGDIRSLEERGVQIPILPKRISSPFHNGYC